MLIELAPEIAPRHAARMRALARQGFYAQSPFYRVIKGFMAQTGGKKMISTLPNLKREFEFKKAPGSAYVSLSSPAGEFGYIGAMAVALEPDGVTGHALHCTGVASMAHPVTGPGPDGANSQFFLMRGHAPGLDKTFSAWGRVLQGQDVVDAIADGEPPPKPDLVLRARIAADLPPAQRPQIEVMDTRGAAFAAVFAAEAAKYGPNFNPCLPKIETRTPSAAAATGAPSAN